MLACLSVTALLASCSDGEPKDETGRVGEGSSTTAAGIDSDAIEFPVRDTPAMPGQKYQGRLGRVRVTMTAPRTPGMGVSSSLGGSAYQMTLRGSTFSVSLTSGYLSKDGKALPTSADGLVTYLRTVEGLSIKATDNESIGGESAITFDFEHRGADATIWHQIEESLRFLQGEVGKIWIVVVGSDLIATVAEYQSSHNPDDKAVFAELAKSLKFG